MTIDDRENVSHRALYAARKGGGRCAKCGGERAPNDPLLCARCRNKKREAAATYRATLRRLGRSL